MLTNEQVESLKETPLDGPNKLRAAMDLPEKPITQVDLAEGTGLTQPYVSSIINGKTPRLPLDTARKFADYFGCAIEDLFPAREAVERAS